ncbi:MAG: PAS domain S-box protein [Moorea sp. SIO2B7]|nr:PAS domain S-box protein [Moorena sp. SIO2B7]
MIINRIQQLAIKKLGNVSLLTILLVPFAMQIFAVVGLTGYLSFRNGQKAVNELVTQLSNSVTARIDQRLQNYLNTPHLIQQVQADAVRNGTLNITDFSKLEHQFWNQIELSDAVDYIYYGNKEGNFLGVQKYQDGRTVVKIRDLSTAPKREIYLLNSNGDRLKLIKSKNYDPRVRPWYKATIKKGLSTWSPIYISADLGILQITPTTPIYDEKGSFIGVLATNLLLSQISDFLRELKISKSGKAFIIEHSGNLVASSQDEPPFIIRNDEIIRLNANNSSEPIIKLTVQHLWEKFGKLHHINAPTYFRVILKGKKHLVQISPIENSKGLEWLSIVAIPESDFMEQINTNTRNTFILCFSALVLAIILGIFTSRWISNPILKLSKAAQAIASGKINQNVEGKNIKELEVLAGSFNSMARQLRESFEILEAKNADLEEAKEALAKSKEQLEAVINAVPGPISWIDSDGFYLGVNQHLAGTLNLSPDAFIGQEIGFLSNSSEFAKFMDNFIYSSDKSTSQIISIQVKNYLLYYLVAAHKYQQGKATVSVGIDITERKKAQEALRIAEENYRSIFENALEGIFQSTPEGQYISVNPAMARIYGYNSPEEMITNIKEIGTQIYVDPNGWDQFKHQLEQEGKVKDWEYQVYGKDGSILWIKENTRVVRDDTGKVLYYEGIIENITKRKQKEEALKREVEELKIEIDKTKQNQQVADIVEAESFQTLKQKLTRMKQKRRKKFEQIEKD